MVQYCPKSTHIGDRRPRLLVAKLLLGGGQKSPPGIVSFRGARGWVSVAASGVHFRESIRYHNLSCGAYSLGCGH